MTLEEAKQFLDTTGAKGICHKDDYKIAKKWALKDKGATCLGRVWCNEDGFIVASDGKRMIELNTDRAGKTIIPASMQRQKEMHVSGTAKDGKGFLVCDDKEDFSLIPAMEYPKHGKFFDGLKDAVKFQLLFDVEKTVAFCDAVNAIGGDFRCVKLTYRDGGIVSAYAGDPNGVYVQCDNIAQTIDAAGNNPYIGNAVSILAGKCFIGIDPTFLSDFVRDFPRYTLGYIGAEKPLYAEMRNSRAIILPMRIQ